MDEITREFLVESQESLNQVERDLVALEKDPGSTETLSAIFRVVHSIKGSVGFLGFQKLGAVAHAGESLLSGLRAGSLQLTPAVADGLLALFDAIREMLGEIEASGRDGDRDYHELIDRLAALGELHPAGEPPRRPEPGSLAGSLTDPDLQATLPRWAAGAAPGETVRFAPPSGLPDRPDRPRGRVEPEPPPLFPEPPPGEDLEVAPEEEDATAAGSGERSSGSSAHGEASITFPKSAPPQSVADSSIRVDVSLLDRLMALVGELVLARNQVLQHNLRLNDPAFGTTSQRLNLLISELQEGMMRTRMQPIGTIFSKLPRMVRDLALGCGKRVRVVLEGELTELDKTVIEAIKDPLTHLVRNAVDHGIEPPERRAVLGKTLEGIVSLRAFHEGGQVGIEIHDDGAGIDPERLKRTAVERGLIARDQSAQMSDRELLNLIFLPGFSTAEQLTLVSGRGVGMDVVKTGIEKIGGSIELQSRVGEGTAIKIKIPLTLAIIKVLLVSNGAARFAIPQVNLVELVRLKGEAASRGIEWVEGAAILRYRGRLLPLVDLKAMLAGSSGSTRVLGQDGEPINIVVVQPDAHPFGLVVDRVNDSQEIVVRALAKQLRSIACFEGATILGDGTVALILDVAGLARLAGVIGAARPRALPEVAGPLSTTGGERRPMLLLEGFQQSRLAVPLGHVARLETFPRSSIAHVGQSQVVHYRGEVLTLIDIATALSAGAAHRTERPGAEPVESETVRVVVCSEQGRHVGLVCKSILDIVNEPIQARGEATRQGVLYTAMVQDRVTEVLDVPGLVGERSSGLSGSTAAWQREG